MKRRVVIAMITALFVFISVAGVSADNTGTRWNLLGTYEMSLTGTCLHSPLGFKRGLNSSIIPKSPADDVWTSSMMATGKWIFKWNGTGTVEGENFVIDSPPGSRRPAARGCLLLSLLCDQRVRRQLE